MVILLLFYLAYPAAIKKGTIMGYRQVNEGCASKAQVEIPTALLAQLISSGMLIGTDCVCPVSYTHLTLPTNREV